MLLFQSHILTITVCWFTPKFWGFFNSGVSSFLLLWLPQTWHWRSHSSMQRLTQQSMICDWVRLLASWTVTKRCTTLLHKHAKLSHAEIGSQFRCQGAEGKRVIKARSTQDSQFPTYLGLWATTSGALGKDNLQHNVVTRRKTALRGRTVCNQTHIMCPTQSTSDIFSTQSERKWPTIQTRASGATEHDRCDRGNQTPVSQAMSKAYDLYHLFMERGQLATSGQMCATSFLLNAAARYWLHDALGIGGWRASSLDLLVLSTSRILWGTVYRVATLNNKACK